MSRSAEALWCATLVLACVLQDAGTDVQACGGQLTHEAGQILSPNFPHEYPPSTDCSWVITVQEGKIIDFKFLSLDLEDNYHGCSDYVALHNGPSLQDAIVSGDLCLSSSERQYRSRGHQMLVHFHSDNTVSRGGFSASYKTVDCQPFTYGRDQCDKSCTCKQENTLYCNSVNGSCVCKPGWTSADCSVDIDECSKPYVCSDLYSVCVNTPGSYNCSCLHGMQLNATGQCVDQHVCKTKKCSHVCGVNSSVETCYCPKGMKLDPKDNMTCQECDDWKFGENCAFDCDCYQPRTESCDKVEGLCSCYLNWTSTDCTQDVDECSLEKPPCKHSFCHNTGGSFYCTCPQSYEILDDELPCQECGRTLTNTTGSIVSHQYDYRFDKLNRWEQSNDCNWTIEVTGSHVISLQFPYANNSGLSSCKVDIFDGDNIHSPLIGSYDTRNISPRDLIIRSSGNKMFIVRHSWYWHDSFVAIYTSHECPEFTWGLNCSFPCQCVKNNTDHCDSITGNCICKNAWKSADCSVDVDECTDDPLVCPDYSDCLNLHGSYNCTCKDGLVQPDIGCTLDPNRGYCKQPSTRASNCSEVCITTTASGQPTASEQCFCPIGMTSEAGRCAECKNMTYGPDCSRQCQCVENNTARCDPQTGACECLNTWTGPQCSQDIDECYLKIADCLPMSHCVNTLDGYRCACYETDHEESKNGACECDHELTNSTGNFVSPNYPERFGGIGSCSWNITVADGDVILLSFSAFGLYPYNTKCDYEYLAVYDGHDETARLIGQYCRTVPDLLRSTGNKMFLKFVSKGQSYTGFNASYTSHPYRDYMCGYGLCDVNCTCNIENTLLCESSHGVCICKEGWVGTDCSTDLDECVDSRAGICTDSADCVNTIGSFWCRRQTSYKPDFFTTTLLYTTPAFPTGLGSTSTEQTTSTDKSPTVRHDFECHLSYMQVFIPVALVPNSELTLRDPTCKLNNNGTHHKITFAYDECDTSKTSYEDYIDIQNDISVHTILNGTDVIAFVEDYKIPLQCSVDRSKILNSALLVVPRENIAERVQQSSDFTLKEYTSADYSQEITDYPVQVPLNREIFFEITLKNNSNSSIGVYVEQCQATPSPNPNDTTHIALIDLGCPAHPAVNVQPSAEIDHFRFSTQAFRFSAQSSVNSLVYIHCSVSTCGGETCKHSCSSRSRRRRRRSARILASTILTSGSHVVSNDAK